MSKKPSPEQEIRNLKREVKQLRRAVADEHARAGVAMRQQLLGRARATKAEQEVAEWERRFDALLARTPESATGA